MTRSYAETAMLMKPVPVSALLTALLATVAMTGTAQATPTPTPTTPTPKPVGGDLLGSHGLVRPARPKTTPHTKDTPHRTPAPRTRDPAPRHQSTAEVQGHLVRHRRPGDRRRARGQGPARVLPAGQHAQDAHRAHAHPQAGQEPQGQA